MVKASAAHSNAGYFPPIVVASGYDFILVTWVARGCFSVMCDALCYSFLKVFGYCIYDVTLLA
jgi:hypothetical protein